MKMLLPEAVLIKKVSFAQTQEGPKHTLLAK